MKLVIFNILKPIARLQLKAVVPQLCTMMTRFFNGLSAGVVAAYVFSAPLNIENSNFQQSPLIVPTFL
jgi:hypothetical protein